MRYKPSSAYMAKHQRQKKPPALKADRVLMTLKCLYSVIFETSVVFLGLTGKIDGGRSKTGPDMDRLLH